MSSALALGVIRSRTPGFRPRVALVLGSGWAALTDQMRDPVRIAYAELEGFPAAGVPGHGAELWLGRIGEQAVALLSGRQHGYETGSVDGMKTALRVLRALGCEVLVQTNAAGSLRPEMPTRSLMLLADHINFPQRSPLVGESGSGRFVSMVDAYAPELRAHARTLARQHGIALHEGVYGWCLGPQFETPAEVRMLGLLGADAVGMSTVPETILARHAGMRVLALSLITNMAAGLSDEALSHDYTLAQGRAGSESASRFLAELVATLPLAAA